MPQELSCAWHRRPGSACGGLHAGSAAADLNGRHLLQQASSAAERAARAHRGYLTWLHGEMMIVAFVGLMPFGVWTAFARRSLNSRWWFQIHRAVQARGLRSGARVLRPLPCSLQRFSLHHPHVFAWLLCCGMC